MTYPLKTALGILALSLLFSSFTHAAAIPGQGTWETTLLGRDLDGNNTTAEAYYDTALGITWLKDANHAGSAMNWATATNWAGSLNPYGSGITGWRLPDTNPINGSSYNYTYAYDGSTDWGYNISAPGTTYAGDTGSELAHMFYNTLGNVGYYDASGSGPQSGSSLSNTGYFDNLQSSVYWSGTEYAPSSVNAWAFNTYFGYQYGSLKGNNFYAWAVHSGDVGASVVPIPAAVWLFGSGLIGLIGWAKRKR